MDGMIECAGFKHLQGAKSRSIAFFDGCSPTLVAGTNCDVVIALEGYRHAVRFDIKAFDAYQHWFYREAEKFGPLTTGCGYLRGDTPLVAIALEGNDVMPSHQENDSGERCDRQ